MPNSIPDNPSSPFDGLQQNMEDVGRLLEIHVVLTGTSPGRRYKVAVLNKSGVVLITACWEAFIEDTVITAFDFIKDNISSHKKLPRELRKIVANHLKKDDKHELNVWNLAGEKWKDTAAEILKKPVDWFNTPTSDKIDKLFDKVLALKGVSERWFWPRMSKEKAKARLDDYVNRRHDIAHRSRTDKVVSKPVVKAYTAHIHRLAVITSNTTRDYVYGITQRHPWHEAQYQTTE
ncbi:HEPN domain-containing protein [Planctomycetota bacterium]